MSRGYVEHRMPPAGIAAGPDLAGRLLNFGAGWRPGALERARRPRPLPHLTARECWIVLVILLCAAAVLAVVLPSFMLLRDTCAAVERCSVSACVDFEGELVHLDWAAADAEIAALGGPARAARWLHCCVSVPGQLPSDQRWVAWAMLGRCGRSAEEVVPELVAAMCSDATEDRERIAAAIALGRIGGPRAAGYLVLAMREKRYEIRCLAQSGLAEFEPAELSSVLIPVLDRGDAQARSMAVRLLGRRGDFRAVPVLEAALRTEADRGVTEDIRLALAELRRRLADR